MLLLYSMYSFYFTFLDRVKAILVHRAHRLLSESTLILRTLRGDRPRVLLGVGFDGVAGSVFCRARAEEHYALSKTDVRGAQCQMFRRDPRLPIASLSGACWEVVN